MSGPGHHTTQRFHLAQFAGDQPKGHVWVYNKTTGRTRSDIPESISVENNFYSIERDNGTWDTRLDDWITGVEGAATRVYKELLGHEIPPYSQKKYDFALYLAVSYARTRTQQRVSTDFYGKMFQTATYAYGANDELFAAAIKDYETKHAKVLTPERREEFRDLLLNPAGKVTVSVSKDVAFWTWGVIEKLTPIFLEMEWSIVEPEHGYFITSDNPLLRQVAKGTVDSAYGDGGFMNKTVNVTFPLSPKKMLLLSHKKYPRSIWETPRQFVEAINHARASHCEHELYAHIQHKEIAKMAERYKNERPAMELSGFGPEQFAEIRSPRRFKE